MKFIVELLLLSNILLVSGLNMTFYTAQELEILDMCSLEYQTTLDISYFITNAKIPDETDHNMKCLFYCVPQKIGVTDDQGVVNALQIKDMIKMKYPSLRDHSVKILMRKCGKGRSRETDKCNKWYNLSKCIWKLYLDYKATQSHHQEKHTEKSKTTLHQVRVNHTHHRTTKNVTETTTSGLIHPSEIDIRNGP